jgi:hypothetical protein
LVSVADWALRVFAELDPAVDVSVACVGDPLCSPTRAGRFTVAVNRGGGAAIEALERVS